jgi:tRNA 2-thiouridine synthesizing protein A
MRYMWAMSDARRYDVLLDARGLVCPLPLVKARQALMVVEAGATICVLATDPEARSDFERFCEATGHLLHGIDEEGGVLVIVLEKTAG